MAYGSRAPLVRDVPSFDKVFQLPKTRILLSGSRPLSHTKKATMKKKIIKLFLRLAISIGFLSAVGGAFALSLMKEKYLELDSIISKYKA